MNLRRLCKWSESWPNGDCPAVYVDEDDPTSMVGQGEVLGAGAAAQLLDLAVNEGGFRIPTETVLRAAGIFLAERGRPSALVEVEAFLAGEGR